MLCNVPSKTKYYHRARCTIYPLVACLWTRSAQSVTWWSRAEFIFDILPTKVPINKQYCFDQTKHMQRARWSVLGNHSTSQSETRASAYGRTVYIILYSCTYFVLIWRKHKLGHVISLKTFVVCLFSLYRLMCHWKMQIIEQRNNCRREGGDKEDVMSERCGGGVEE